MSCKNLKKKSVNEIFDGMDICDELNNCNFQNCDECLKIDNTIERPKVENLKELGPLLKFVTETKSFGGAVDAAVKAHNKWKNWSPLKRAHSLHEIWKNLRDFTKSLSKFKTEFLTLVNYFDFYADLPVLTEEYKNCSPCGIVLVILTDHSPFFVLGATIPPALATGCSVIVLVPEALKIVPLFLEEIIIKSGLPEGVLNTVAECNQFDLPDLKEINKVFFCGSYSSAVKLYTRHLTKSFNFFCPGNTSALILESGDLDAAVDKIVTETCSKNSLFSVSNVVVQESVYKNFLEKLKYRLQQFIVTNKNSLKLEGNVTLEKVQKVTTEALNACTFVEKYPDHESGVGKIVTVNYQDQDVDNDVALLKVLLCRTTKEGVALLNNCRCNLGTSIWSEISSQALEVSLMLECPNIWINGHGVHAASEPLQLSSFSGNCVLGGSDGIFEYMSCTPSPAVEESKSSEAERLITKNVKVLQMAVSAQSAFNAWKHTKNRRQYIKEVAEAVGESEELSNLSDVISSFAHYANWITASQGNSEGFLVLKRKIPVGVFLLLVNTVIDATSFASLITPIIAFGNAVIVVLKEENSKVALLTTDFNKVLPKNLFNVILGIKNGIHLASDPHIKAIWVYDEWGCSTELLQTIKSHSARSLKHIWVIPKSVPLSHHWFQKECLRNQVVWLTPVDKFP